jgi:hypothetical protein
MVEKVILFLIFVVCILPGCKDNRAENDFFLDEKIKLEAKPVKIDTIGFFDDLISAEQFFVYQDTILIVQNRKYEDVYFLEFYDLKRRQLLHQLFRLGNGPYEMLSAIVKMDGSRLTVNDFIRNQVAFVDIDSVLYDPFYLAPVVRHYYNSPTAVRYKEEQLLMENPNCFQCKELGVDQKAPRFIIAVDNQPYLETPKYRYYTRNVAVDGEIITNYPKDRIIYANDNHPKLEIYNNDLRLIKQIQGPDKLPAKYIIENNAITFYKYIPYAYMDFSASGDFVYLTYIGNNLTSQIHMEDLPVWIFKFDWDGNFIESYSVGRYITTISLSTDGKSIYATAISEEKKPFLIKITLHED